MNFLLFSPLSFIFHTNKQNLQSQLWRIGTRYFVLLLIGNKQWWDSRSPSNPTSQVICPFKCTLNSVLLIRMRNFGEERILFLHLISQLISSAWWVLHLVHRKPNYDLGLPHSKRGGDPPKESNHFQSSFQQMGVRISILFHEMVFESHQKAVMNFTYLVRETKEISHLHTLHCINRKTKSVKNPNPNPNNEKIE